MLKDGRNLSPCNPLTPAAFALWMGTAMGWLVFEALAMGGGKLKMS